MDKLEQAANFDIFDDIYEDDDKMENGTWVEYGHGIEFQLASQYSRRFNFAVQKFREANPQPENLSYEQTVEADKKYQREVWGPSIIRGWRTKQPDGTYANFIVMKGQKLTWSPEAAGQIAVHRLFRTWVAMNLAKDELFRQKQAEAEAKN